jgi:voltage-gated potassium channel Kch
MYFTIKSEGKMSAEVISLAKTLVICAFGGYGSVSIAEKIASKMGVSDDVNDPK